MSGGERTDTDCVGWDATTTGTGNDAEITGWTVICLSGNRVSIAEGSVWSSESSVTKTISGWSGSGRGGSVGFRGKASGSSASGAGSRGLGLTVEVLFPPSAESSESVGRVEEWIGKSESTVGNLNRETIFLSRMSCSKNRTSLALMIFLPVQIL